MHFILRGFFKFGVFAATFCCGIAEGPGRSIPDFAISSAAAQTSTSMPVREKCRKGIDCCWIGKKPLKNQYSKATDTSDATGQEVLALGGYTEIVFGPARPASCATHWRFTIAPRLVTAKPSTVFENWNTAVCGGTNTARFRIDVPTRLTEIVVWYAWRGGEAAPSFMLVGNGTTVAQGVLIRGACAPRQAVWCEARATVAVDAAPGNWALGVDDARICRNEASGGNGFVRVIGVR